MIRFLWDENASHDALRALRRLNPAIEVISIQEAGLAGVPDERVIDFAVSQGRVIVTGDRNTLIGEASARTRGGAMLPGVIVIPRERVSPGLIAVDLVLIADVASVDELTNQFVFLPLA